VYEKKVNFYDLSVIIVEKIKKKDLVFMKKVNFIFYLFSTLYLSMAFSTYGQSYQHSTQFNALKQAAEQGTKAAQYQLGMIYRNGYEDVSPHLAQSAYWLEKAAKQGDIGAQIISATIYEQGQGVQPNEQKTVQWIHKVAQYPIHSTNTKWKKNIADAQYQLGLRYLLGRGLPKNESSALTWFEKAAKNGHPGAAYQTAHGYKKNTHLRSNAHHLSFSFLMRSAHLGYAKAQNELGLHFEQSQSYHDALLWYKKAAESDNVEGKYNLGRIYYEGKTRQKNIQQARYWLQKAAHQGHALAQTYLGKILAEHASSWEDKNQSLQLYQQAANQGQAAAQYHLGLAYLEGSLIQKSDQLAYNWLVKAAEKNHALALYQLAIMYEQGLHVPQSNVKAFEFMHKAAKLNAFPAQRHIAWWYETGKGVQKNLKQAFNSYLKLAQKGHLMMQVKVAEMYEAGQGTYPNLVQAVHWYKKAAEQHHLISQKKIAQAYETGKGINQNKSHAFFWYGQAARLEDPEAQYDLARLYEQGIGTKRNISFAIDWYQRAEILGYAPAKKALDLIYQGVKRNTATTQNKSVLSCPKGSKLNPITELCFDPSESHLGRDGIVYLCNRDDPDLIFDPHDLTCHKPVFTDVSYQSCPKNYTLNKQSQSCERATSTYKLAACPAGYRHDGQGVCEPYYVIRAFVKDRFTWEEKIVRGKDARFDGTQVIWDGDFIKRGHYKCGNHRDCGSFEQNGYVYKKSGLTHAESQLRVTGWKKYRSCFFCGSKKKPIQWTYYNSFDIQRKAQFKIYRTCPYGYTQDGLQCTKTYANFPATKFCQQGQFTADERSCVQEHIESADPYSESSDIKVYQGQQVKQLENQRVARKLQVSKPNEQGLAVIKIDDADVDGEVIEVNNYPQDSSTKPASIIVLHVQRPIVNAHFKILGDAADVILIHENKLICEKCDFDHTPRVVLASGKLIDKDSKLTIRINEGQVEVKGSVHTPDTALLDIITQQLQLTSHAHISTNFHGYRVEEKDDIKRHPQGAMEFGSGKIQILLGRFDYDYITSWTDTLQVTQAYKSLIMQPGSRIDAGSIVIQSLAEQGDLHIDGLISAQSDASVLNHYQGQAVIGRENVNIHTLGALVLNGFIEAGEQVELNASHAIEINLVADKKRRGEIKRYYPYHNHILAKDIYMVSLNSIINQGSLAAKNLHTLSANLYNEGVLKATGYMTLQARNDDSRIENRFGGVISAERLGLKSGFLIRNGSKFNYRDEPLRRHRRSPGPIIDVGTYFRYQNTQYREEVKRSTAKIYAVTMKAEAPTFENVNPYHLEKLRRTGPENRLYYNADFDNTAIVVQQNAQFALTSKFINGSAFLKIGGSLFMNAPEFFNERYRIRIETECGYRASLEHQRSVVGTYTHNECIQQVLKITDSELYKSGFITESEDINTISSPAGRITVEQDFILKSDAMKNTMGFLEVQRDFSLNADKVDIETYTLNYNSTAFALQKLQPIYRRVWFATFKTGEACTKSFTEVSNALGEKYCYRKAGTTHQDNPMFSALVVGRKLHAAGHHDFSIKVLNRTDGYGQPHQYKKETLNEEARIFLDQAKL